MFLSGDHTTGGWNHRNCCVSQNFDIIIIANNSGLTYDQRSIKTPINADMYY